MEPLPSVSKRLKASFSSSIESASSLGCDLPRAPGAPFVAERRPLRASVPLAAVAPPLPATLCGGERRGGVEEEEEVDWLDQVGPLPVKLPTTFAHSPCK